MAVTSSKALRCPNLIQAELITEVDFKRLTFDNAAEIHFSMNPEDFAGTFLEEDARMFFAEKSVRAETEITMAAAVA